MKIKTVWALLALAGAFNAHAQSSGSITIDGTVSNAACTPSVNSSGASATVILPTLSTGAWITAGLIKNITPFTISLSGCASSVNVARAHFYSNFSTDGVLTKASGDGSGWGYLMLPAGVTEYNGRIKIGPGVTVLPIPNDPGGNLLNGATTITYQVAYYVLSSLVQGTLNSQTNYVMYYQ